MELNTSGPSNWQQATSTTTIPVHAPCLRGCCVNHHTIVLTIRVAVCTAVAVAYAVTMEAAGAEGLVMKQLHAELV